MNVGNFSVLSILVLSLAAATTSSCSASKKTPPPAAKTESHPAAPVPSAGVGTAQVEQRCLADMKKIIGRDDKQMQAVCRDMKVIEGCSSVAGQPIYHYDRLSENPSAKRILTFALIHGDEGPSGAVARAWIERLAKIDPQNNWRIVPVLNPDGWSKNTRVNSRGIDLNRNFPTANWKEESQKRWVDAEEKDARRFPGDEAASEPETKCAMLQIDDFKPNFIISVHTPFGVLDFDGPRMKFPQYKDLPWFSLGNFPGSMGRYMWVERRVPVLTIELKGNEIAQKLDKFDKLQDVTGIVAIQSEKILNSDAKKKSKTREPELGLNSYSEDKKLVKTSRLK